MVSFIIMAKLLIPITRVIAAYFAFVEIGGFIWFLGSHDIHTTIYFITTFIALCVFAVLPRRLFDSRIVRVIVGMSGVVAIFATIPMLVDDLNSIYEPHYLALIVRFLVCGLIFLMLWESLIYFRKNKNPAP